MTDLCKLSGLVLGRMIASREIKPSEVMQAVLDRDRPDEPADKRILYGGSRPGHGGRQESG